MNKVKGGKAIGKWIKHVASDELKNAGLTAIQFSYASSHWLDKKIFSDIAREKNVTPGAVWITLNVCQAKILKRRAEMIMGVKPGVGASKKTSTAPITTPKTVVKTAETEPAGPVQPPAIKKPSVSAKLPPAIAIKPDKQSRPADKDKDSEEVEVAIVEDPEEGKTFVAVLDDEEEPSDECLDEIEASIIEMNFDDPRKYIKQPLRRSLD